MAVPNDKIVCEILFGFNQKRVLLANVQNSIDVWL